MTDTTYKTIEEAVAPMKQPAVEAAAKFAFDLIDRVHAELEEHGWDLNAAAPRPVSGQCSREQYQTQMGRHNLFQSVTRIVEGQRRLRQVDCDSAQRRYQMTEVNPIWNLFEEIMRRTSADMDKGPNASVDRTCRIMAREILPNVPLDEHRRVANAMIELFRSLEEHY